MGTLVENLLFGCVCMFVEPMIGVGWVGYVNGSNLDGCMCGGVPCGFVVGGCHLCVMLVLCQECKLPGW